MLSHSKQHSSVLNVMVTAMLFEGCTIFFHTYLLTASQYNDVEYIKIVHEIILSMRELHIS